MFFCFHHVDIDRLSKPSYAYSPVEVGGWGDTSYTGPSSSQFQSVVLNIITNEQCNDNYPYRITASQMCLLTAGKDTCNVSNDKKNAGALIYMDAIFDTIISLIVILGGWRCWIVSCWYGNGSLSHYRNAQLWSRMWYASATSCCTCFIIHSMDTTHHQRKLLHDLMDEQSSTTRRMLNNDDNIHT